MNARAAGESLNMTAVSPAPTTGLAGRPDRGERNTLKPVTGFAFVDDVITPPRSRASNTIAAFGGVGEHLRDGGREVGLQRTRRAAGDVRRVAEDLRPSIFSAAFTDGSVHLILWVDSWSYFAGPPGAGRCSRTGR